MFLKCSLVKNRQRYNFKLFSQKSNYEVLGLEINKNPTKEEIKDAYYKLAKIYHPDSKIISNNFNLVNKNLNHLSFQKIQAAYQELIKHNEITESNKNNTNNSFQSRDIDEIISKILKNQNQNDFDNNFTFKKENFNIANKLFYSPNNKLDEIDFKMIKYKIRRIKYIEYIKKKKKERIKLQNEKININNNTYNVENLKMQAEEFKKIAASNGSTISTKIFLLFSKIISVSAMSTFFFIQYGWIGGIFGVYTIYCVLFL